MGIKKDTSGLVFSVVGIDVFFLKAGQESTYPLEKNAPVPSANPSLKGGAFLVLFPEGEG